MTDLVDRLQELAEGAAREVRPPGTELAVRRGRRRRRRLTAGVALAVVLAVALVGQGRLADWSAPVPPAGPGEEAPRPTPFAFPLTGAVEVGRGQLPQGGSWRLEAGTYDDPDPAGKPALGASLTVAFPGRPTMIVSRSFEEPVRLGVDTDLTAPEHRELPLRPVFGAASRQTARVEVIPRRGPTVLSPVPARLLDGGSDLPARFWIALLPSGGPACRPCTRSAATTPKAACCAAWTPTTWSPAAPDEPRSRHAGARPGRRQAVGPPSAKSHTPLASNALRIRRLTTMGCTSSGPSYRRAAYMRARRRS